MSSFGALIEKKMDRARRMVDKVKDHDAHVALSAIYDVLDLVFTEVGQPQVVMVDPEQLKKKDSAKPQQVVQTAKVQSAGEKIAGQGGLYL